MQPIYLLSGPSFPLCSRRLAERRDSLLVLLVLRSQMSFGHGSQTYIREVALPFSDYLLPYQLDNFTDYNFQTDQPIKRINLIPSLSTFTASTST